LSSLKPRPLIYNPPRTPLCVVYKDADLLVLSKPSGLLSVPGKDAAHKDCLETRAKEAFPEALLVHRLDLETSGIFVMAMNKDAQANLGKQFERRKVRKVYTAEVWGHVEGESGVIDLPLRCDWENRPRQMVCYEHGKAAQTHWQVSERLERSTRMRLEPQTGRSHQLRVHMMHLGHEHGGHPILGDPLYAHEEAFSAAPRLLLHAAEIELHHPKDGERVTFRAQLL